MKAPPQHPASWPPPLCTGHKTSLDPLPEVQENTGISNFYLYIVAAGWRSSCSPAQTTQAMVPPRHRHCSCGKAKLPIPNMMAAHRHCCVPPPCTPHRRGELWGFSSYVTGKKNPQAFQLIFSKTSCTGWMPDDIQTHYGISVGCYSSVEFSCSKHKVKHVDFKLQGRQLKPMPCFSQLGSSKSTHRAHMAARHHEWQLVELLLPKPSLIMFVPLVF